MPDETGDSTSRDRNGVEATKPAGEGAGRRRVKIAGRSIPMPRSRVLRRTLGGALVVGGLLGFLPVVGFWMMPLGLLVLSHDSKRLRRVRRRLEVRLGRLRSRNGS